MRELVFYLVVVASVSLVAACGGETDSRRADVSFRPSVQDTVLDVADGWSGSNGLCQLPEGVEHVVDGAFTDWTSANADDLGEWSCALVSEGIFTYLYVHYDGERLHLLNDWHLNMTGPVPPTCFNQFDIFTGGGAEQWIILVYGDGSVETTLNGEPYDGDGVEGATGFGRSPLIPDRDHTIYELSFPASPGPYGAVLKDPEYSVASICSEPGGNALEPTVFVGELAEGGGGSVTGQEGLMILLSVTPPAAPIGDLVRLHGLGFGDTPGRISFDGLETASVMWSDEDIDVYVPAGARSGLVWVVTDDGRSNPLPFEVLCKPSCDGRQCGDDGCGGTCGQCPGPEWRCEVGACVCAIGCGSQDCGEDGCGQSCGTCEPGIRCRDGHCECTPQCGDRVCGDDGCGGSCGECPSSAWRCDEGVCACAVGCGWRECGEDDCGQSCGTCAAGRTCRNGRCECTPQCDGRECGDDGCGGSCGTCTGGSLAYCQEGVCRCEPNCDDAECGSDGCGGSCGDCGCGAMCRNGGCQFTACDGRECGDDGCGGSCGTCDTGTCMDDGSCCVPSCSGLSCGPDGCGGSCGTCDTGICMADGSCCVPSCSGQICGSDGCGGSCGTCTGAQEVCADGKCVCAPDCTDRDCGDDGCGASCGTCDAGQTCTDGRCVFER